MVTRDSAFQRYVATRLSRCATLACVMVESGDSAPAPVRGGLFGGLLRALRERGGQILAHPIRAWRHFQNRRDHHVYYGQREAHERRVLREGFEGWPAGIPVVAVGDVNEDRSLAAVRDARPDLVVVFGTRLVRERTMQAWSCPAVNLHWGWSPEYRGEGIVTALALEGPQALGVTVHLLSSSVDAGDILLQARPQTDADDNFYAVGLRLSVLGADLLEQVITRLADGGTVQGTPQDLSRGRNRGTRFMREHPELVGRAWRRLKELR